MQRKIMSRLGNFHWEHKSRDVKRYGGGCIYCQPHKDSNQQKRTDPTPSEKPERRWEPLATGFVVGLPKMKKGCDAFTIQVYRMAQRVDFIECKSTDTAVDFASSFFSNFFKLHVLLDSIVLNRVSKFTFEFRKRLRELCGVKQKMFSSRHSKTGDASEITNQKI